MDKEQLIAKIKQLPYYLYLKVFDKRTNSGLKFKELDERNFKTSALGWSLFGSYTPKQTRKIIEPFYIFNQGSLNICTTCGTLGHKMDDERVELLAADAISYAQRKGWVSGNGLANVDTYFKVLKEYGCCEGKNPDYFFDWNDVSTRSLNTAEAAKHKISSYWEVSGRNDILKLLDEGRTLNTGIDWYTGFNQGGGFGSPWIIRKALGYAVGGHDIKICGYDTVKKVYIFVNSYGKEWGDSGLFYIDMDYFDKHNYGVFTSLDIENGLSKFLNQYDGQNVKGNSPAIFFIQKGVRKVYPDWSTFLSFGGKFKGFIQLDNLEAKTLELINLGDQMDIRKSPAWDSIQNIGELDDKNHELMSTLINLSKQDLGLA